MSDKKSTTVRNLTPKEPPQLHVERSPSEDQERIAFLQTAQEDLFRLYWELQNLGADSDIESCNTGILVDCSDPIQWLAEVVGGIVADLALVLKEHPREDQEG